MEEKNLIVKEQNKKSRFIHIITLAIFVIIILLADLFLIFNHGKTFSEKENRILQQAPVLTGTSLTSGKFMSQAESFISDQFFARDGWISYKLSADKLMGKREANGVYLGNNGYLIEMASEVDEKNFSKNLEAIASFAESSDLNIVMSVVPNAVSICDQLLPAGAPSGDQSAIISEIQEKTGNKIRYVDLTATLTEHKSEGIYYKSDHHWTSLGAKYGFETIAPYIGIDDPVENYSVYYVTDSFCGTLASASGASYVKDDIQIYVPDTQFQYVVEYVGENLKSATIYDSAALETNSKYEVFLGGNHPLIKIRTDNQNDKNLLLIKDSYANAFVQFILPYYNSIYIVDPRYYSDDLDKLIADSEITDVLLLYNVNTFVEDNSLADILQD